MFRPPFPHPIRPRRRQAVRPCLEDLEVRMTPAVSTIVPGAGGIASMVMQPTFEIYQPAGKAQTDPSSAQLKSLAQPSAAAAYVGFTPQQIRTSYGVNGIQFGTVTGDGTGQTIAIVDAYDDPCLVDSTSPNFKNSDLALFDQHFGLPDPPSFIKLGQDGSTNLPGADPTGEWEIEEALDVEWAHAMAPGASIVLIECASSGYESLLAAGAKTAASLPGVSVVTMSFGTSEFSSESYFDTDLMTPSGHQGVTFVASTGDNASPALYPGTSPNVLAVGGTTLSLNANNTYQSEAGWSYSGGGPSAYAKEPAYQFGVQSTGRRSTPDVSFDADPLSGVAIYDSYQHANPWFQIAGTSLAAPCWAGLIAIADQGRVAAGGTTLDGPSQTLPALYSLPGADFHDVTTGSNGYTAGPGYDMVTGIGSPVANLLVPGLAGYQSSSAPTTPVGSPTAPGSTQLVVTSQAPPSLIAGTPFSLTVTVEDTTGSAISSFNGPLIIALVSAPHEAALGGTLLVNAVNGTATFSNLSLISAGSGYTLAVAGGGMAPVFATPISVVPAAASRMVNIYQPSGAFAAGTGFVLAAAVEDQYGNLETSYYGAVTLTQANNPVGGVLSGALTVAANQGVAIFTGLAIVKAGTGYTVQYNAGALTPALTSPLNVVPATAVRLVLISAPPATVTVGSSLPLTAVVEDAFGNVVSNYSGKLAVTLAGNKGKGRLAGTLTAAVCNGVATFPRLSESILGSGYALRVTGAGLASATTAPFNVVAAPKPAVRKAAVHVLR